MGLVQWVAPVSFKPFSSVRLKWELLDLCGSFGSHSSPPSHCCRSQTLSQFINFSMPDSPNRRWPPFLVLLCLPVWRGAISSLFIKTLPSVANSPRPNTLISTQDFLWFRHSTTRLHSNHSQLQS
jgi:hypothetical protein